MTGPITDMVDGEIVDPGATSEVTEKNVERYTATPRQDDALALLSGRARHVLLYGGSRSGKTFLLVRTLIIRASKCPSRHVSLRKHFAHAKTSIWLDTLPRVMELCFPELARASRWDRVDHYLQLPNGSEFWIGGLDDRERTEKILGREYATMFFNEASEMDWESVTIALTRLAQKSGLKNKCFYDCVAGDTILDGHTKTIKELSDDGLPIKVLTTHGWKKASPPWLNGIGKMYEFVTESGKRIEVTASHRFWTKSGWERAENVTIGQQILCNDELLFLHGERSEKKSNQEAEDLNVSCCKHPHRHDGQSPRVLEGDRSCLASSSDAKPHNQYALWGLCRDGQDSHRDHLFQPEARRIRRSRLYHELLSLKYAFQLSCTVLCFYLRAFGSFLKRFQFYPVSLASSVQIGSSPELLSVFPSSYNFYEAFDAPVTTGCKFSTVVAVKETTTKEFFTLEVPSVKHYVANGFISHNCNPPKTSHWTHRLWIDHADEDGRPLPDPENYVSLKINPGDNLANIDPQYISGVLERLPLLQRKRFLDGEFGSDDRDIILSEWIRPSEQLPSQYAAKFTFIDPAATEAERATDHSCESAIVTVGVGFDDVIHDVEVLHGYWSYAELKSRAQSVFARHNGCGTYYFGAEKVGAQMWLIEDLRRMGIPCIEVSPDNDKIRRTISVTDLLEQGRCRVNDPELSRQLLGFPGAKLKDLVDAYVYALKLYKKYSQDSYRPKPVKVVSTYDQKVWAWMDKKHKRSEKAYLRSRRGVM